MPQVDGFKGVEGRQAGGVELDAHDVVLAYLLPRFALVYDDATSLRKRRIPEMCLE